MTDQQSWLDLFKEHRSQYLEEAREKAEQIARQEGYVTVDMLRAVHPLPKNIDGRVYGAVFKDKRFVSIGWVKSTRRISHGRPIQKFVLNEEKDIEQRKTLQVLHSDNAQVMAML